MKLEPDPLDALDTALNDHAGKALDALDKYAKTHPGLDLDDTGLPKVEQQRRSNTTIALLKDMVTHSGVDFERLFLLANINVLNQARHTAEALADLPQDESGKKLAQRLHKQFDDDYSSAVALLDKHYFCSPDSN